MKGREGGGDRPIWPADIQKYIYDKISKIEGGIKPAHYVLSRVVGQENFLRGDFTYFGYARSKTAPDFFLKRKIFLFLGQVQILVVVKNGVLPFVKWDFDCPKLTKMGQKDEKQ